MTVKMSTAGFLMSKSEKAKKLTAKILKARFVSAENLTVRICVYLWQQRILEQDL